MTARQTSFLLQRIAEDVASGARRPEEGEAMRRVVVGAERWVIEHHVELEQTPMYPTLQHLAQNWATHEDHAGTWS